jgi:hypothetical protein
MDPLAHGMCELGEELPYDCTLRGDYELEIAGQSVVRRFTGDPNIEPHGLIDDAVD